GIMIAMILYNLFIYFSVRDKSYIYYVVYIICVMFTQAVIQGYPYQYLWPNSSFMAHYNMFIFPILVGITGMEFMKVFLKVKTFSIILSRFSFILAGFYCLSMVLAAMHHYKWAFHLLEYTAMTVSVYMLCTSIMILRKGFQPAKYFLIAWIVFLMGICVYVLKDFEILPFNNFTRYTMQIGSAIETVLLSFALAARINIYKKEKEDSQAKALELSKENEKIITEQKILLETKVKERTRELEETNRNLEETREQLINVEKMASLGQLTAGISHEINNPINFVVSNIQPLKRDIKDIVKVLEKYNEIKPSSDIEKKLEEITRYKNEIDLDYLLTEIDLLLKGIDEGASRTSEIVKGLKNFSRVHEVELQFCDIHEGLDSTLGILNSIITSSQINIVKQYGNFPQVECFPGKLNQVFMNILNNAVHAVGLKKYKNGEGKIIIKTSLVNDQIEIKIKDNGIGIAKANQSKIFEPFYTTKPVGAGTGLGLSIVYGIINSHNGTIEINSQENEGAEFVIRLPLRHERV
ncbi:MAG: 7TM diverse intracellular signaling domain-containing protein, partial [Bacteroidia bacterium]